jgi:hypothetical protein
VRVAQTEIANQEINHAAFNFETSVIGPAPGSREGNIERHNLPPNVGWETRPRLFFRRFELSHAQLGPLAILQCNLVRRAIFEVNNHVDSNKASSALRIILSTP